MKAWVLHGVNDLRYEERELPETREGEVLLRVEAAGICGSDIPRIYDTGAHVHPLIPGHEFAGAVVKSADPAWVGKRVGVFPLIPCRDCDMCREKKYEMCRKYSYLGSRCDGGFAEYVCVPVWNLIELPEEVFFEQAACLEPLAVAVHAVRRAKVTEDDTAVIIGFGTIGALVARVLQSEGIKDITAVVNKESHRKTALAMGLNVEHYDENRTAGTVVFECVGRQETAARAIESAAPGGCVVMVGNPHSDMAFSRNTYWKILRSQLTVLGTWNSSFTKDDDDDWHQALALLKNNNDLIDGIITHRMPLENLKTGLHIMRDKTETYGKIMLVRYRQEMPLTGGLEE